MELIILQIEIICICGTLVNGVVRIYGHWVSLVCCFPFQIMEKSFVAALCDLTTITRLWWKLWWEKRGKGFGIWRFLPPLGCWSWISSSWRSDHPIVVFCGILGLFADTCQVKQPLCLIPRTTWKLWGVLEAGTHERLIFPHYFSTFMAHFSLWGAWLLRWFTAAFSEAFQQGITITVLLLLLVYCSKHPQHKLEFINLPASSQLSLLN